MSTKFFTNDEGNTLLSKFAGVFANNTDIERFDALVGYLRAYLMENRRSNNDFARKGEP